MRNSLPEERQQEILEEINKALDAQFSNFSWDDMIDCLDALTPIEKKWAKEHTGYDAYIC